MNINYKVFNPLNLSQELNLDYCANMDIEIRLPIRFNYYEKNLIKRAKYYGYNIFDKNDPFYNDACTKFTYDNMDISLSERQNLLNLTGKNLCIPGCNYSNFDIDNMKSICKCKNYINSFIDNSVSNNNKNKDEDEDELINFKSTPYNNKNKDEDDYFIDNISKYSNINIIKIVKCIEKISFSYNYGLYLQLFISFFIVIVVYSYNST